MGIRSKHGVKFTKRWYKTFFFRRRQFRKPKKEHNTRTMSLSHKKKLKNKNKKKVCKAKIKRCG